MYRMASCRQACLGKVPYLCCLLQLQSSRSADAVASLAQYEVSVSSRMLPMQEQTQQKTEEKQLSAATNGNLPWKRRGGATAGGYLSRSLL